MAKDKYMIWCNGTNMIETQVMHRFEGFNTKDYFIVPGIGTNSLGKKIPMGQGSSALGLSYKDACKFFVFILGEYGAQIKKELKKRVAASKQQQNKHFVALATSTNGSIIPFYKTRIQLTSKQKEEEHLLKLIEEGGEMKQEWLFSWNMLDQKADSNDVHEIKHLVLGGFSRGAAIMLPVLLKAITLLLQEKLIKVSKLTIIPTDPVNGGRNRSTWLWTERSDELLHKFKLRNKKKLLKNLLQIECLKHVNLIFYPALFDVRYKRFALDKTLLEAGLAQLRYADDDVDGKLRVTGIQAGLAHSSVATLGQWMSVRKKLLKVAVSKANKKEKEINKKHKKILADENIKYEDYPEELQFSKSIGLDKFKSAVSTFLDLLKKVKWHKKELGIQEASYYSEGRSPHEAGVWHAASDNNMGYAYEIQQDDVKRHYELFIKSFKKIYYYNEETVNSTEGKAYLKLLKERVRVLEIKSPAHILDYLYFTLFYGHEKFPSPIIPPEKYNISSQGEAHRSTKNIYDILSVDDIKQAEKDYRKFLGITEAPDQKITLPLTKSRFLSSRPVMHQDNTYYNGKTKAQKNSRYNALKELDVQLTGKEEPSFEDGLNARMKVLQKMLKDD